MKNVPKTKKALKAKGIDATPDAWLQEKAKYDSELWGSKRQYWVIDNKMYDLRQFGKLHPGGAHWIHLTQGQNISEHFRIHHLNMEKPVQLLKGYYVGQCSKPQPPRYTFHPDGLYQAVATELLNQYKPHQLTSCSASINRAIVLFIVWLLCLCVTGYYESYVGAIACGFVLLSLNGVAHNFVHKRPNIYQHLYILSAFTVRQWQIMHCLSHHIYPNTLLDYEITAFYPLVNYLRVLPPNWPYIQIVFEPILILLPLLNLLLKIVVVPLTKFSPPNVLYLLTLTPIILLYIINGDMYTSICLFVVMQMSFGFFFAKSVFCGHRVPDLWTEGEAEVADFGLHTVISSADTDQKSTGYHSLLMYTGFNIHVAHHFFPTIDHEHLWKVQEILEQVCRKRGIKLFSNSMIECNKKISKLYHSRQVFKPPIHE